MSKRDTDGKLPAGTAKTAKSTGTTDYMTLKYFTNPTYRSGVAESQYSEMESLDTLDPESNTRIEQYVHKMLSQQPTDASTEMTVSFEAFVVACKRNFRMVDSVPRINESHRSVDETSDRKLHEADKDMVRCIAPPKHATLDGFVQYSSVKRLSVATDATDGPANRTTDRTTDRPTGQMVKRRKKKRPNAVDSIPTTPDSQIIVSNKCSNGSERTNETSNDRPNERTNETSNDRSNANSVVSPIAHSFERTTTISREIIQKNPEKEARRAKRKKRRADDSNALGTNDTLGTNDRRTVVINLNDEPIHS